MRDDDSPAIGALVRRAVDGDQRATHDLLAHVHPLAERYCRTRLSRLPGDARHFVDDLAQEVCLAVLCALPRYRDLGRPFEAFVVSIAAHKVADLQRAAMRRPGSTVVPSDEMPEKPKRGAPLGKEGALVADLLKLLLKIRSREIDVAARLLTRSDELEALAAGVRKLPVLEGWRREVFGADALDLVEGKLAFGVEKGRLKMTHIDDVPPPRAGAEVEPQAAE